MKIIFVFWFMLAAQASFAQIEWGPTESNSRGKATFGSLLGTSLSTVGTFWMAVTNAVVKSKGVAWREAAADELPELAMDIRSGLVDSFEKVRQPLLRELMEELMADEALMKKLKQNETADSEFIKLVQYVSLQLI